MTSESQKHPIPKSATELAEEDDDDYSIEDEDEDGDEDFDDDGDEGDDDDDDEDEDDNQGVSNRQLLKDFYETEQSDEVTEDPEYMPNAVAPATGGTSPDFEPLSTSAEKRLDNTQEGPSGVKSTPAGDIAVPLVDIGNKRKDPQTDFKNTKGDEGVSKKAKADA